MNNELLDELNGSIQLLASEIRKQNAFQQEQNGLLRAVIEALNTNSQELLYMRTAQK